MSKKKSRELKVRGEVKVVSKLPPSLQKGKEFLDKLPVDEATTCRGLSEELGITENFLQSCICRIGEEYRYKEGHVFIYGNPETIRLKREGFYDR